MSKARPRLPPGSGFRPRHATAVTATAYRRRVSTDLAIAFWNRNKGANPTAQAEWLAQPRSCGCPDWDVLILAEVTRKAVASFADLANHCVAWTEVEGMNDAGRAHGVMILSRRRMSPVGVMVPPVASPVVLAQELVDHVRRQGGEWDRPRPLRRERWLVADVPYTAGERPAVIRVSGFHAPFAAGRRVWDSLQNRLTKRLAYQQLAAWAAAQRSAGVPTVVGLDGNNWSDWGRGDGARSSPPTRRYRSPMRQRLDEAGLFDAESAFHGPDPSHGLVDTFRAAFKLRRARSSIHTAAWRQRRPNPRARWHSRTC